jgi:hypothetical protein
MTEPVSENQSAPHGDGKVKQKSDSPAQEAPRAITKFGLSRSDPECCNSKKAKRDWFDYGKAILEIFGLVILCLYTAYTIKIWRANRIAADAATESLNTLKDQFQRDQRPYMFVEGFQMFDFKTSRPSGPVRGKPIAVTLAIKNGGKSPAFAVAIHRHILFGSRVHDLRAEPPDKNRVGTPVGPNDSTITTTVTTQDTFANESYAFSNSELLNWDGSDDITVFGRITYEDGFGNLYCTPYIAFYLNNGSGSWVRGQKVREPTTVHSVTELCPVGKP